MGLLHCNGREAFESVSLGRSEFHAVSEDQNVLLLPATQGCPLRLPFFAHLAPALASCFCLLRGPWKTLAQRHLIPLRILFVSTSDAPFHFHFCGCELTTPPESWNDECSQLSTLLTTQVSFVPTLLSHISQTLTRQPQRTSPRRHGTSFFEADDASSACQHSP